MLTGSGVPTALRALHFLPHLTALCWCNRNRQMCCSSCVTPTLPPPAPAAKTLLPCSGLCPPRCFSGSVHDWNNCVITLCAACDGPPALLSRPRHGRALGPLPGSARGPGGCITRHHSGRVQPAGEQHAAMPAMCAMFHVANQVRASILYCKTGSFVSV